MELAYTAFFVVAGVSNPADYSAFTPPIVAREVATARPFTGKVYQYTPATTAQHAAGHSTSSPVGTGMERIRTFADGTVRRGDTRVIPCTTG